MEDLKYIQDKLIECVECQMEHLSQVNAKELGEVIDMIKDISETMYYHTITEAMEGDEYREYEKKKGRMYYGDREGRHEGTSTPRHGGHGTGGYMERELPIIRDHREGRSPMSRKVYMESKETHKDKNMQMHELERYVNELTEDLMEMISDSTPEEKQMLSNKIATLATKIK